MSATPFANPDTSCFNVGSIVRTINCFDEVITGEVTAFDASVKMLMLKCLRNAATGDQLCDLCIVNLSLCKNVKILQEAKPPELKVTQPARLNFHRLDQRLLKSVEQRNLALRSRNAKATPLGQELFQLLAKQFGDDALTWQGDCIHVLNQVLVTPPYDVNAVTVEHVKGGDKLLLYIRRIIEKLRTAGKQ